MSYGNWFQWTTTDLSKFGSFPSLNSFDWIDFFRFLSKVKAAVSVATPTGAAGVGPLLSSSVAFFLFAVSTPAGIHGSFYKLETHDY